MMNKTPHCKVRGRDIPETMLILPHPINRSYLKDGCLSTDKPFSQACENNKGPILSILQSAFAEVKNVLEVGSGTGQHAVYFAKHMPHLGWQPTDLAENLLGVELWLDEAKLGNISSPKVLDVSVQPWAVEPVDAIFSANTLHIMGKPEVVRFFGGVGDVLLAGGRLCVYGPFNYEGRFTSESNARFNEWLYRQNPNSAIRDFEWVNELALDIGLELVEDHAMPANNRLLEWQRL